ncbi:MFS transporter [Secundilactobacillus collinoides]|uniref:MFS transporter n=1 Tax=Secundilactobacillus collinoides TaxID=33960 RepID=UPI0007EE9587|nr:MFS transporter [Secundilactobacillus collinoides]
MSKPQKRILSICLYLNYLVHGFGLIILTQNMQSLGRFWSVPIATVSYVVSGIGIGRLLAYFVFGYLSDRFGRKFLIYVGVFSYLIFFLGMPFVKNIQLAYLFAIMAGIANSALDSGTYPTFVEMGGKSSASNVFIKAFMSVGEFILPLLVATLDTQKMWFGWSFMVAAVILVANFFLLNRVTFPKRNQVDETTELAQEHLSRPKKWIATAALSIYGYTSMAIMILFTQWITMFATNELNYSALIGHGLLSLYSIGSISGVIVTFALLRRQVSEAGLLVVNNALSLVALVILCTTSIQWLSAAVCFVFGFTAAGGMMQVALNIFLRLYPQHKGLVTGTYFTFGSVATFTVPVVTGWLSKQSIARAMDADIIVGILGTIVVLLVAMTVGRQASLTTARKEINHLDKDIVKLLAKRFDAVTMVNEAKRASNLPVMDHGREDQVLKRVAENDPNPETRAYMQDIYTHIMRNSREYQAKLTTENALKDKETVKHDKPLPASSQLTNK